ncbi:MAG: VOC family protein [Bacteroidetes bacterium]|nr:VOC family protein [Bacteroidota bacterium]
MERIEHIGLAVRDLAASEKIFEKLLGRPAYKKEFVASEQVTTVFFKVGDVKIELLGSENKDSAIGKFLDKRGEGIHHIAFHSGDLQNDTARLTQEGFAFTGSPRLGAENKMVNFIHPASASGVLVELCMDNLENHE